MSRSFGRWAAIGAIVAMLAACTGSAATSPPVSTASATATKTAVSAASVTASAPKPRPSGSATCSPGTPEAGGYSSEKCEVDAPSLANNKLGDPAKLNAIVLVPSTYAASTKRYPVVYMLAGYTEDVGSIDSALYSGLTNTGTKPEIIVVLVDGVNSLGGSFYVNSPVTGNWDDAITVDLVGYVDAHYRTLAAAKSRGIAGSSMGGFGAINLAMLHPDVFGATYAMSPGLFDDASGPDARLAIADVVTQVLETQGKLAGAPVDPATLVAEATAGGEGREFEYAYGAAFAPDPSSPILMRFPFRLEGSTRVRDDEIWHVWCGGFGNLREKLQQYGSNLKALRGIGIDYGTNDYYEWIPKGSAYFVKLLQNADIPVTANVHNGNHTDLLPERMSEYMLPFMAQKLATE